MYRYVALIWNAADVPQGDSAQMLRERLRGAASRWIEVFHRRGLIVLCADRVPGALDAQVLAGNAGVVLGALYKREEPDHDAPCARVAFDDDVTNEILASGGEWLLRRGWGNYVALICRGSAPVTRIIKDPCGNLPAFVTTVRGLTVVFSAVTDCLDMGLRDFTVNRRFLELHISGVAAKSGEDALNEVTQVRRGEGVEIDPRVSRRLVGRRFYWTPFRFPQCDECLDDFESARQALRSTVHACVSTWASGHRSALLRLSGGLDSSIVLGCLAETSETLQLLAYTHHILDRGSDPRPWARMAAEHAHCPHAELSIQPEAVDLPTAFGLAATVEPSSKLMYLTVGEYEQRMAAARGASAVFTGEGGDSSFGSLCIGDAVSVLLRRRGLRPGALVLAAHAARVLQQSTLLQLARGVRSWWTGHAARTLEGEQHQASQLVARRLTEGRPATAVRHPWFEGIDPVPWEAVSKVSMLLSTPDPYSTAHSPATDAPQLVSPLYSQPLVELSLRIPADVLFADGRERGLARQAFADVVPKPILDRQSRDRPGLLHQPLIARHIERLRRMLLDGVLVNEGLLDRVAAEHALSTPFVETEVSSGEILRHLDTELWVRQWSQGSA
jgi:asparagine synthase (glutamine-hydrolysing)